VEYRLAALERALDGSRRQLDYVREAALRGYAQVEEFGEALDRIWTIKAPRWADGRLWLRRGWAEVTERPVGQAAEERVVSPGTLCPHCGEMEGRRRARHTLLEIVMRVFYFAPYRCSRCRHRYYRFGGR